MGGITTWFGWLFGQRLDRETRLQGYLIASTVIFGVCWMGSIGLTGSGDASYLDPEKAKRARETGEYVWMFVLYVTIAYLAMSLGWLRCALRSHERRNEKAPDVGRRGG